MKVLRKYWPIPVLLLVVAAVVIGFTFSDQFATTPGNNTNEGTTGSFSEEDPVQVTLSEGAVSSIMSALNPGFTETTDEPENQTDSSNAGSSDKNTGTSSNSGSTDSEGQNSSTDTTPPEPEEENHIVDSKLYASAAAGKGMLEDYPEDLKINGVKCAFDETSKTYCYSISERAVNVSGKYVVTATFNGEDVYMVFKNGEIQSDGAFKPSANQTFDIRLFTDNKYRDCKLRISTMPIMVIETENRVSLPTGGDKTTTLYCTIEIHNPDADIEPGDEFVASYATIHNRGASSMSYPKKSLKIELQKFETVNGQSVMTERNKRLLGMRDDDDWILDACYADPTMVHNKMAYNLWEEIGGDSNPDALLAGPHCEFVEVIMNGKYHGLFLLVEPVDEKQMGVQKSNDTEDGSHGVYIKAFSWGITKFDTITGSPFGSNGTGKTTWDGFEMKYPENNISAEDWTPLYNLLSATATLRANQNAENIAAFRQVASKLLKKENIVNYWIMISVTLARDNAGKNIHYSITNVSDPNMKLYINVWDMDNSFGYRYGPASSGPVKDPVTTENYADAWFKLLRYYLKYNVDGAADYLQTRWAELTKKGAPCSVEGLLERLNRETSFVVDSGAFAREQSRWPATGSFHASLPNSMETEIQYATEWITARIPVVAKIVQSYKQ